MKCDYISEDNCCTLHYKKLFKNHFSILIFPLQVTCKHITFYHASIKHNVEI